MIDKKANYSRLLLAAVSIAVVFSMGCQHGTVGAVQDDPIASYEYGQSRTALTAVEAEIRDATPQQMAAIEDRMLNLLKSKSSTYEAKDFACRMLRRMGSEKCVPTLEKLLYCEKLSDMARFALQGLPYPEVDAALRKALKKLDGDYQIGVIGTIGQRGDAKAIPELAKLARCQDPAVARASISALRQIGGIEATRALEGLQ